MVVLFAVGAVLALLVLGAARYRRETVWDVIRALWAESARVLADVRELEERRALLLRPWEEEWWHWSHDGTEWRLHGHRPPPPGRRSSGATGSGWCPGLNRDPEWRSRSTARIRHTR